MPILNITGSSNIGPFLTPIDTSSSNEFPMLKTHPFETAKEFPFYMKGEKKILSVEFRGCKLVTLFTKREESKLLVYL